MRARSPRGLSAVLLLVLSLLVLGACLPGRPAKVGTATPPISPTRPASDSPPATATPIVIHEAPEAMGDPGTVVKWYVGLRPGSDEAQVAQAQVLVDDYNQTNADNLYIALNVVPNAEADKIFRLQLDAGTPPDIIGPVGLRHLAEFQDQLLPLDDLLAEYDVDLAAYDQAVLDPYRNARGQLVALPYLLNPSFIYFNKDLFDAAGLAYPPQRFGALYQGQPWDMDALRQLSMQLTLDASGKNAAEPGFDATRIVQFGFAPQQDNALTTGVFFGSGDLTGPDNEATIPQAWKESWTWFYQARHVDHFVPDAAYENGDALGQGTVWSSGRVAMAWMDLSRTCCFTSA